jgi:hypothetical protein
VPAEVLDGRLSEAVARALEQHRAELAELVEQQVEAELERLAPELVDEALARRNGASAAHGVRDAARTSLDIGEPAATAELKRCSTCRRELPRSEYGPDRRSPDGLRARCRECRQRREYPREVAARRARRAREKPRRAAQGPASDDDAARPDPRPAENGRAAHNGSHRERAPSDDEWLLAAGFAMLDEHGRLVATDAGLDAGSALGDPRVFA